MLLAFSIFSTFSITACGGKNSDKGTGMEAAVQADGTCSESFLAEYNQLFDGYKKTDLAEFMRDRARLAKANAFWDKYNGTVCTLPASGGQTTTIEIHRQS